MKTRAEYADIILKRLIDEQNQLRDQYRSEKINFFYIDNLLPNDFSDEIFKAFPDPNLMKKKRSWREFKNVAAQMDQYNPTLEEIIYAFQDSRIVKIIGDITNLKNLEPDENLYAGGISLMSKGNFLNPHLDNSHDKEVQKYRVLNLLYYVTPNWEIPYGGNLELWPNGVKGEPIEIHSKFNRLVVMVTNKRSFHSVNKVKYDGIRCCVSNYYFSEIPAEDKNYFHVTTFYGRPEELMKKVVLKGDAILRQGIRKIFKKGLRENPHVYKKDNK